MTSAVRRIRWGVLGVAKIATDKVIPGMQRGAMTEVVAIASRDASRARHAADALNIPTAHASYETLLDDPTVDAVYIPLPNHLHVAWAIRAAERGKHVLCEKPIALNAAEAERLLEVRDRTGVKIQEAFMVHTHPQWREAVAMIRAGRLGDVRAIAGVFSYYNDNPANVRNVREFGGGGLLDIGCYLVHTARWMIGREPGRVAAVIDRDSRSGIDRVTSMLLDFENVQVTGTCATQLVPYQRVQVFGTTGRLEIEIPFNAPVDRPTRLYIDDGSILGDAGRQTLEIAPCDQYTIQGDEFSRAILDGTEQPLSLERTIGNMRVLDGVARAAQSGRWEPISP